MKKYIVSLDQGTTSSRAIIFNEKSEAVAKKHAEIPQIYPHAGWVEHDPLAIYSSQYGVMSEVLTSENIAPEQIAAIGITNQRETTIIWDKKTGEPVYNAIVWQCRRTMDLANAIKEDSKMARYIEEATGLRVDAYFSATKIKWILDHVEGVRSRAEQGELLFGTVDTWILWKLTNGAVHRTDYTNASRTMLFNIETLSWDEKILAYLDIPQSLLPEVGPSSDFFGTVNVSGVEIPITGMAGDQQAALFGQTCFEAGDMKNTYGTGCFLLLNTGKKKYKSQHGLLTTICASRSAEVQYALEGSAFVGGAAVQWLRDELGFFEQSEESSEYALSVPDNGGVYFVPAFTGLAAPHWDMEARGGILGLTRGVTKEHIIRAALEGIAFQVNDLIQALESDTGLDVHTLRVDGGASNNAFLMQFQADISDVEIRRPQMLESTALGAAYLAGLEVGYWESESEIIQRSQKSTCFPSKMSVDVREKLLWGWNAAIGKILYQ